MSVVVRAIIGEAWRAMERGRFYFITGGASSGKSEYAEQLAAAMGRPVVYVATAEAGDQEMQERIARHRQRRPATWETVEEPLEVARVLGRTGRQDRAIIIDCLTLLITNLIYRGQPSGSGIEPGQMPDVLPAGVAGRTGAAVMAELIRLADIAWNCCAHVILVSSEVGLGLVPADPESRLFRDLAGWANQLMAARADHALMLVSGLALDLKAMHCSPGQLIPG